MLIKKLTALMAAGVLAISFVGCSSDSAASSSSSSASSSASIETTEEGNALLEKGKEALGKVESYNSNMTISFEFVNEEGTSSATVDTEITELPTGRKYSMSSVGDGEDMGSSDIYVREENGQNYLYVNSEGQWYKTAIDDVSLKYAAGQYAVKDVASILLNAVDGLAVEGEEDVNGVSAYKTTGVISAENVPSTLINSGAFIATGMVTLTESHLEGVDAMPVTFWFDKETGDVVKFAFDAGDAYQTISDNVFALVEGTEGYEDAEKLVINQYYLEYTLENINNATEIEYPAELDSALEMTDETATGDGTTQSGAAADDTAGNSSAQ
jgi:hypothetical protein